MSPTSSSDIGLSSRAASLPPSATLAVTERAKALRAEGRDVLSFAAGEPDFPTPAPIVEAAKRALDAGQTKYSPSLGDTETRTIIAEKLERENGIAGLSPRHVGVSVGGKHSLYNIFQALLDPGDEVLLPTPAWVSYAPQVQLAGGIIKELPTGIDAGFRITPEQLRDAITPESRVLVMNSPSNPCGTMYSPDDLRAIARVVAEASDTIAPRLVVVSDEIYEKITFGQHDHLSPGAIPDIADRVVTCNGLSKAYSMTGWRVGYCAAPGAFGRELLDAIGRLQSQMTSNIPSFILPAIRVALTQCSEQVETMRAAFAERALIIERRMREIPGLSFPTPEGAFYVFADVSAHFGKRSAGGTTIDSALSFAAALLDEDMVAVVPGEDFGGCGDRCVRFSFACSEQQIHAGMDRLASFVSGLR
ncbi:MAG: pyridoxal phosphate-dependent aminotransferase [Phycisphaerales bacterium]